MWSSVELEDSLIILGVDTEFKVRTAKLKSFLYQNIPDLIHPTPQFIQCRTPHSASLAVRMKCSSTKVTANQLKLDRKLIHLQSWMI